MSWTFTVTRASGDVVTATVRDPEFSDQDSLLRHQAKGFTRSGLMYVQDLGRTDRVLALRWAWLDVAERAALETFFGAGGTQYQSRGFQVAAGGSTLSTMVTTGMSVGGVSVSTGLGYNTGQAVVADTVNLGNVRLDQPDLVWTQVRTERYSTEIRLRVLTGTPEVS